MLEKLLKHIFQFGIEASREGRWTVSPSAHCRVKLCQQGNVLISSVGSPFQATDWEKPEKLCMLCGGSMLSDELTVPKAAGLMGVFSGSSNYLDWSHIALAAFAPSWHNLYAHA